MPGSGRAFFSRQAIVVEEACNAESMMVGFTPIESTLDGMGRMAGDGIIDLSAEAERRRDLMQLASDIVEKADPIAAFYALERAWGWGRADGINEAIGIAEASLSELAVSPPPPRRSGPRPPARRPRRATAEEPVEFSLF
jgi:hypothetical protein